MCLWASMADASRICPVLAGLWFQVILECAAVKAVSNGLSSAVQLRKSGCCEEQTTRKEVEVFRDEFTRAYRHRQRNVAEDKGLLAMDESNPTCNKRFARLGIPQTEEARRAYRELIVTTPGLGRVHQRRDPL